MSCGDSSYDKVFATEAWGHEFTSPEWQYVLVIPVLGKKEQEVLCGLLARSKGKRWAICQEFCHLFSLCWRPSLMLALIICFDLISAIIGSWYFNTFLFIMKFWIDYIFTLYLVTNFNAKLWVYILIKMPLDLVETILKPRHWQNKNEDLPYF